MSAPHLNELNELIKTRERLRAESRRISQELDRIDDVIFSRLKGLQDGLGQIAHWLYPSSKEEVKARNNAFHRYNCEGRLPDEAGSVAAAAASAAAAAVTAAAAAAAQKARGVVSTSKAAEAAARMVTSGPIPPPAERKDKSPSQVLVVHPYSEEADQETRLWDRATGETLRLRVHQLLKTFGPQTTRELYEKFEERGWRIPGKSPQNNLSAHLSRSNEFVNTNRGWMFLNAEAGS